LHLDNCPSNFIVYWVRLEKSLPPMQTNPFSEVILRSGFLGIG